MKLPELWNLMLLFCSASSNLYASVIGLEKLLKTENTIMQMHQSFVLNTEQQIAELKRQIERLEKDHQKTATYISNPFSSFHLIRRILIEWKNLENILSDSFLQETRQNMAEIKSSSDFPTEQDMIGSIDAINLITDTYDIDISSLANGIINGIQYPSQLSADDCHTIGIQSFMTNDFQRAYSWMDEALKRYLKERNPAHIYLIEKSLEFKAYSAYQLGDISKALNTTIELLKHNPNNAQASGNIEYYIDILKRNEIPKPQGLTQEMKQSTPYWDPVNRDICRKAISPPVEITSRLKCRYIHNDIPFLRLAPIKEEEAFLNPRIVLFKDALSDPEIEILKELAIPKLQTALVINSNDGSNLVTNNRIAQASWIDKNEHPTVRNILLRAEDMTKLDSYWAEQLQVLNYGVGGHYKPHLDSLEDTGYLYINDGDRIATLLFYMNDVDQGGATVFSNLNVGVWPEKGTAILWYNQLPDGNKKDERSMHGACPVVAGTKWICTIWFRAKGQELRRPCELKQ